MWSTLASVSLVLYGLLLGFMLAKALYGRQARREPPAELLPEEKERLQRLIDQDSMVPNAPPFVTKPPYSLEDAPTPVSAVTRRRYAESKAREGNEET